MKIVKRPIARTILRRAAAALHRGGGSALPVEKSEPALLATRSILIIIHAGLVRRLQPSFIVLENDLVQIRLTHLPIIAAAIAMASIPRIHHLLRYLLLDFIL